MSPGKNGYASTKYAYLITFTCKRICIKKKHLKLNEKI